MPTFGAEIEKPISDRRTGQPRGVSPAFFPFVNELLTTQSGTPGHFKHSDKDSRVILGVQHPVQGDIGLDNGSNNQETATKVVDQPTLEAGLVELESLVHSDLSLVQAALKAEGATAINMSIHPLGRTDLQTYKTYVAPKTLYQYLWIRRWDHTAGIDAKAQNSPATGVEVADAARAVTTIIGAGAAVIGLFGNSPIAEGQVTGVKESRCTMWDRMMRDSISAGDRATINYPDRPFASLSDYFTWMFGPGTNIHFVIGNGGYKSFGDSALLIDGNPSVLEYLQMPTASAHRLTRPEEQVEVTPRMSHMEATQFAQFVGARIRWAFTDKVTIPDFLNHLRSNTLEGYLANGGVKYTYIEGRDPGANFPDRELTDRSPEVASSTVVAPSAIQAGLIHNLDESAAFIRSFDWQLLGQLRQQAIVHGLDGHVGEVSVFDFARHIVDIAARGLPASAHHMLAYPEHVLQTKQNGADRALAMLALGMSVPEIVISRNVVV